MYERGRAAAAGLLGSVWKVPPPLDAQTSQRMWGESSGSGTETRPLGANAMMLQG